MKSCKIHFLKSLPFYCRKLIGFMTRRKETIALPDAGMKSGSARTKYPAKVI
jgi:hypothetical protein